MASKSKKRRRVLGASCILAALIIAGSSFAWFTSKDEVTNRLSANADYGVSIVESFAPPENWLPGQEVNKDVYAVNTGSIPAYVREKVSGGLTITREEKVSSDDFDSEKDDLITLTKAERYVTEAGSYLAYKPEADTTNKLGDQIVSMVPSGTDLNGYEGDTTDFTPAATGLYVFRRTIDVASNRSETFDKNNYAAYYYDKATGKFYKVDLTSITPDNPADYPDVADDGIRTDGNLIGATYTFAKDVQSVVDPTDLTYDAAGNRLVVTFKGQESTVDSTTMNQLAADLDVAWHNFDKATEQLAKAQAGNEAAQAAIAAAQADANAKKTILDNLEAEKTAKEADLADIQSQIVYWEAQRTQAASDRDDAFEELYGENGSASEPKDGSKKKALDDATEAYNAAIANDANRTAFYTEFRAYCTSLGSATTLPNGWNTDGDDAYVDDADLMNYLTYDQVKAFGDYSVDPEAHEVYERYIEMLDAQKAYNDKLAEYNGYVADYNTAVATLGAADAADDNPTAGSLYAQEDALQTRLAALGDRTDDSTEIGAAYAAWQAAVQAVTDAATVAGETHTAAENLTEARNNFDEKYAAYYAAKSAYDTAAADYNTQGADLKIYINLSDKVGTAATANDTWQLLPNPVANKEAVFYYNGILEGGETSSKLIDSIELDSNTTQDMYKSFDFDLNVALDSAQIVYDADQETILTTPAEENFSTTSSVVDGTTTTTTTTDVNAALTDAKDLDTKVTWTSTTTNTQTDNP